MCSTDTSLYFSAPSLCSLSHPPVHPHPQRALLAELEPKLQGPDNEWLLLYYRCKLEPEQGKVLAEAYASYEIDDVGEDGEEVRLQLVRRLQRTVVRWWWWYTRAA